MKNPFKFTRYTSVSSRDGTKPIVPLAPIANYHGGMIPQDGQYVPGEVIEALFHYENAIERNNVVYTALGMGERVYIIMYDAEQRKHIAVPYAVDEIRITRSDRRNKEIYVAYSEEKEGIFAGTRYAFEGESLCMDSNVFKDREDAERRAWALNENAKQRS